MGSLTTYYLLLTTYYSLLTTYYSLLTTHYSLLTTHYRHRGKLNGISQACVALARVCGPMLTSNLFAASASSETSRWPLNYHFVFYLLAVTAVVAGALGRQLPQSIEKQVVEPALSGVSQRTEMQPSSAHEPSEADAAGEPSEAGAAGEPTEADAAGEPGNGPVKGGCSTLA